MRTVLRSLPVVVVLALGCASAPERAENERTAGDPDGDMRRLAGDASGGAVIVVDNPTGDSWDLIVGGAPRGSVAPGTTTRLLALPIGRLELVALNQRLDLRQTRTVVTAAERPATVVLEAMLARLRVDNPHADAVLVSVDGVAIGSAPGKGQALFDGVPAGRRVVVLRSARGPGAVRLERSLPPGGEAALVVPDIAASGVTPGAPRPPEGQGLVRMRNASRFAVVVYADALDYGTVVAGGVLDIVLAPGKHVLEVRLQAIDAHTTHTVTLIPNQVAEWVWGEDLPVQPRP